MITLPLIEVAGAADVEMDEKEGVNKKGIDI